MELIPIASLLMSAPRAVSAAMDLTKRIRERHQDKTDSKDEPDLTTRVQDLEQSVQATADLVAQNAQTINALTVQLDAISRRHRMLTATIVGLGVVSIGALVVAVVL